MLNKTNEVPALLEFAVQLESYELNKYVTNLIILHCQVEESPLFFCCFLGSLCYGGGFLNSPTDSF